MNSDLPESLEDRIAPASLMDAVSASAVDEPSEASGLGIPAEQPFFGPRSPEASGNDGAPGITNSTSIEDGRPIMDVPASSISPAFIDTLPGAPLGGLDATLAIRGLLERDSAGVTGIHDILSGGVEPAPDTFGLAQSAMLSALTSVAGLVSPVLLVDVPKFDRSL